MRIALIGYGKMGHIIEQLGKQLGHEFPVIIDLDNRDELRSGKLAAADVAIEFTIPASAPANMEACMDAGIPVVCGTTGWNKHLREVEDYCRQKNGGLFHASNFSIGVNILFALNRQLARIMNSFPQYRVEMEETHHIHKLDAPSGTAITLAEQIVDELDRIGKWELAGPESGDPAENGNGSGKKSGDGTGIGTGATGATGATGVVPVRAIREGEVKGRHTIQYHSEVDSITLTHDARSREAFATGALMAAEFMAGKKGIYSMKDLLGL